MKLIPNHGATKRIEMLGQRWKKWRALWRHESENQSLSSGELVRWLVRRDVVIYFHLSYLYYAIFSGDLRSMNHVFGDFLLIVFGCLQTFIDMMLVMENLIFVNAWMLGILLLNQVGSEYSVAFRLIHNTHHIVKA